MRSQLNEGMVVEVDISVLAGNIKTRRTALKISQMEVANRMSVDRSAISLYENGMRIPNAETLQKLAAALETTTDQLFGEDNKTSLSQWTRLIDEMIMSISPQTRELAKASVEAILKTFIAQEEHPVKI